MAESREAADRVGQALMLMEQALVVLDGDGEADLIGAHLQRAIDAAHDHQSRAAPLA